MKTVLIGIILAGLAVAAEVPRAMFGVVAEDNAAAPQSGVLVRAVRPGSPAENARLQPGDRLVLLNGQPVNSRDDVRAVLSSLAPGAPMEIAYYPVDATHLSTATVVLGERPKQTRAVSTVGSPDAAVGGDRKLRPLVVTPAIRKAMREKRKAVVAQLAALPGGFVPAEVSDYLQAIRHLARDANPQGRGWMLGEAGEVTLQFKDAEGVLVLHGASNKLTLTVYDAEGRMTAVLPLDTVEERAAVPQEIIERLRRLR